MKSLFMIIYFLIYVIILQESNTLVQRINHFIIILKKFIEIYYQYSYSHRFNHFLIYYEKI